MQKYMPKTLFLGIIVLAILIGVFYMLNMYGYFPQLKYDVYSSKDTRINIIIDYISGWIYREDIGPHGSYAQVIFFIPGTKEVPFNASIAITVIDKTKSKFKTIDDFAKDLLRKRSAFKEMKIVSQYKKKVLGREAIDVTLAYKTADRLESLNSKLIQVKERIIILENEGKFYTARYENKLDQFNKFNPAFNHIIKTLKFKT